MMEWFYIVMAYLMVGLFVAVGLVAFDVDIENSVSIMLAWPFILFFLLMLWIAEKRGPNDPCNH